MPIDDEARTTREAMRAILDQQFAKLADPRAAQADGVQRQRAIRMRSSERVAAFDLDQESTATRNRYGMERFGQGVLLARRLIEHGVTAVEVVLDGWDTHADNTVRTSALCAQLDPAFSALLDDLEERELLDDTLVVCMGEFGRTPRITNNDGRGHWPNNYCVAMAGCGLKRGFALGTTDETGESILERPVTVPDLFRTIAHVLGIDPSKTFNENVRPVVLVDPAGEVVTELLAG